jgi:arylsulfatase A-like enzyme
VDNERLTLSYIMRKSYQRSSSYVRLSPTIGVDDRVPAYMYRKAGTYLLSVLSSLGASRRRFYLVRLAAALGEIHGVRVRRAGPSRGKARGGSGRRLAAARTGLVALVASLGLVIAAGALTLEPLARALGTSLLIGLGFTLLLLLKSLIDFTRTGPHITQEVLSHYRLFLVQALGRLAIATFVLMAGMAFVALAVYVIGLSLFDADYRPLHAALAGIAGVLVLSGRAFVHALLYNPGIIAASSQYSVARFYPLWERLTPRRLRALDLALFGGLGAWFIAGVSALVLAGDWRGGAAVAAIAALSVVVLALGARRREPRPVQSRQEGRAPNILMIGSDTLRADRVNGYHRDLIPKLSQLFGRATLFTDCYVPCARTAPSLISMLTGTWPHTHRVRDTFVRPEDTLLPIGGLPEILAEAGYQTAVVGDWAAADMAKFNFRFLHQDLPPDQWNIKYLLRQGPKDIRLFLSLFTQNPLGKALLPEVYYLGGVPLTEEVGLDTRHMVGRLAANEAPFFLLSFMATNHPPFSSKYPYYTLFADPKYRGPSKFAMSKLTDPYEIIRRQGEPKTEFDLDQIIDLYDGCVKSFDDEVGRILAYLEASGLADNTIVVFFSDHGMEFFEHETWGQGNSAIGDFSARVPLAIADPRNREARRVSDVVRTVDLAPTLLDIVGLQKPAYIEGVSLAPLMQGIPLPAKLPAFYETGVWVTDLPGTPAGHIRYPELPDLLEVPDKHLGTIAINPAFYKVTIAAKDRMVRLGEWKLTYQPLVDGAIWRLFNVEEDPDCTMDVLNIYPEIGARLRALLEEWMAADAAGGDRGFHQDWRQVGGASRTLQTER